jgi:hypothetical protein
MGYGLILALALLKLYLVADQEIVATWHSHDELWYVQQAAAWIWNRPYDSLAIAHLPVYSGFVALNGAFGFPLRLTSELLLIGASWSLSSATARLGISQPIRLVIFALLIFHPQTMVQLTYTHAETFAATLYLLLVAELIRVMDRPGDRWHVAGLSIVTALLWFCREESAPLIIALFGLIAFVLLCWRRHLPAKQYAVVLIGMPLLATAALAGVLIAGDGLRYGVWSTNDVNMPKRAYAALQSIAVDHPKRFIPIPKEARLQAYAVSPAFAELQPIIDGLPEHWGITAGRVIGMGGDIGAGWMHWVLRDAAERTGHYRDAAAAQDFYRRIANEITAALDDGRLQRRPAFGGFIDPEIALWLPFLPSSYLVVARAAWPTAPSEVFADDPPAVEIYNTIAHRRAAVHAPRRALMRQFVRDNYVTAWILALLLGLVLVLRKGAGWSRLQMAIVFLVGFLITSRIGLFAVVDASAWQGNQARYLYPAGLLLVIFPLLLLPRSSSFSAQAKSRPRELGEVPIYLTKPRSNHLLFGRNLSLINGQRDGPQASRNPSFDQAGSTLAAEPVKVLSRTPIGDNPTEVYPSARPRSGYCLRSGQFRRLEIRRH